jgi:hypothetical protein
MKTRVPHNMVLRSWLAALILLLPIFGCTGGYHVDRFTADDGTVTRTVNVAAEWVDTKHTHQTGSHWARHEVVFDAQRREDPDGNLTYFLMLSSTSSDELDIRSGQFLRTVIEGDSVTLSAEGTVRKVWEQHDRVTEYVSYQTSPDILRRLAGAKEAAVVASGDAGALVFELRKRNFANIRRFVEEFVNVYSFTVSANQEDGINTRILLHAEQRVVITAVGVISYDYGRHYINPSGLICTHAGIPIARQQQFMPKATYRTDGTEDGITGSLFGWIGAYSEESAFFVGERREFRVPKGGYLYLAVNDARGLYSDNRGAFEVTVHVLR